MSKTISYLTKATSVELAKFQKVTDRNTLKQTHVPFSGTLRQHPYELEKIILMTEVFSQNATFYEFSNDDIGFVEKLPNIVNSEGDDISMVMLWIKKGSIGIRSAAFLVGDIAL